MFQFEQKVNICSTCKFLKLEHRHYSLLTVITVTMLSESKSQDVRPHNQKTTQSFLTLWRILLSAQLTSWQESPHQRPSFRAGNGRIHLEEESILSIKKIKHQYIPAYTSIKQMCLPWMYVYVPLKEITHTHTGNPPHTMEGTISGKGEQGTPPLPVSLRYNIGIEHRGRDLFVGLAYPLRFSCYVRCLKSMQTILIYTIFKFAKIWRCTRYY